MKLTKLLNIPKLDIVAFKEIVRQHAAEMEGGFLISNQFQGEPHSCWINPRALGSDLAQVTEVRRLTEPQELTLLIKFLGEMITDPKFLIILPKQKTAQEVLPKLDPAIFISRDEVNNEIAGMQVPSIKIPSCLNAKLITIALKRMGL